MPTSQFLANGILVQLMVSISWLNMANGLLNLLQQQDILNGGILATTDELLRWENYVTTFNKEYLTLDAQLEGLKNFLANDRIIIASNIKFNNNEITYELGHNEYSDLNVTQFLNTKTGLLILSNAERQSYQGLRRKKRQLPSKIDWRQYGYVTAINDQKQCGSCYAFSALGALEGQLRNKTGSLKTLSEQMVVDCYRSNAGYGGCNGGYIEHVFGLVNAYKGAALNSSYPYTGKVSTCNLSQSREPVTKITYNYVDISESALTTAIATIGPISVAIDASLSSFQLYRSGVYSDPSCSTTNLNHALLAIGYGTYSKNNAWIIKNSWGTSWGINGYGYLARNGRNTCGITNYALYPILA